MQLRINIKNILFSINKKEDGLGWVDGFDSCACYREEKPAVGDGLRRGQGSWDASEHVYCGGNRSRWSESMGGCFLLCNLVVCL